MLRLRKVPRLVLGGSVVAVIAAACSSSDNTQAARDDAGAGGELNGGEPGSAGSDAAPGGRSSGGQPGAAGESEAGGTNSIAGAGTEVGGNPSEGGSGSGGEIGAGGAPIDFGEPTSVDVFGCFIRSGDGGDLLPNGEIAVNVTNPVYSAACDSAWVSSNENAYAPEQVPTTLIMRRSFIVDASLGAGDFTITYKADDAIDFVLNGQLIIGCTPPAGNAGLCQQICNTSAVPPGALNPPGVLNTLEARLINMQSTPAGNGNFGYTALNYSVCVAESQ